MTSKNIGIMLVYVLLTSGALLTFKYGGTGKFPVSFVDGRVHIKVTLFFAVGIVLYGLAFVLYTLLISRLNLGEVIPLTTGLVYVVVFGASALFFKERFTLMQILGIVVIIGGVTMIEMSGAR